MKFRYPDHKLGPHKAISYRLQAYMQQICSGYVKHLSEQLSGNWVRIIGFRSVAPEPWGTGGTCTSLSSLAGHGGHWLAVACALEKSAHTRNFRWLAGMTPRLLKLNLF